MPMILVRLIKLLHRCRNIRVILMVLRLAVTIPVPAERLNQTARQLSINTAMENKSIISICGGVTRSFGELGRQWKKI